MGSADSHLGTDFCSDWTARSTGSSTSLVYVRVTPTRSGGLGNRAAQFGKTPEASQLPSAARTYPRYFHTSSLTSASVVSERTIRLSASSERSSGAGSAAPPSGSDALAGAPVAPAGAAGARGGC